MKSVRRHLECVAGCAYSRADRAADDGLEGGNLQVQRAEGEPAGAGEAATVILAPVLLDAGAVGASSRSVSTTAPRSRWPAPG